MWNFLSIPSSAPASTSRYVEYRMNVIEKKLDILLEHFGLASDEVEDEFEEVRFLMAQGQKIPAIKLYREIHSVGLKEAKEAVEHLERNLESGS